jgi:hypothetical protein
MKNMNLSQNTKLIKQEIICWLHVAHLKEIKEKAQAHLLQADMSWVRFLLVLLELFFDMIFSAALCPLGSIQLLTQMSDYQ